jgi:hypothetical protein
MADKVLDRPLTTEERQWVRDLLNHPGYRLVCSVVQELMAQDLHYILNSGWEEVLERRGSYQQALKILGLPKELQEVGFSPQSTFTEG